MFEIGGALGISSNVTGLITKSEGCLSWHLLILFHTLLLEVFNHVIVMKYVFDGS